jgi:CheY-like chemotaxis protein
MTKKLDCILLVDDDNEDNHYHQIVLNEMNIADHIEVATNGIEALDFLTNKEAPPPDLIFLDINMPKMNGWEFLKAYENLTEIKKAKIIIAMLTTSSNPNEKEKSAEFPEITGFNSKPLTEEMVNGILKKYYPDLVIKPNPEI